MGVIAASFFSRSASSALILPNSSHGDSVGLATSAGCGLSPCPVGYEPIVGDYITSYPPPYVMAGASVCRYLCSCFHGDSVFIPTCSAC